MKYICPSILSADFSKLGEEIREVENAGADIIHCDIMDGHFVPNISFGPEIVSFVNKITDLPLDVHLMIENPDFYLDKFAGAGADYISVHVENNRHLHRTVSRIKELGVKAGVVLNPATPPVALNGIIPFINFVLVMSVNPGFGGQKFIPETLSKVKEIKRMINETGRDILIEIDGGIGLGNIKEVSEAGVDMFVAGASIFKAKDKAQVIKEMKSMIG